jgi:hypothetical protein
MNLVVPIYQTISSSPEASSLLGGLNLRVYSFGETQDQDVAKPYVVWQNIAGEPENYLGSRPEVQNFQIQVDIYGDSASQVRSVASAILEPIESQAYVTRWGGESRDLETQNFRISFDVDWLVYR